MKTDNTTWKRSIPKDWRDFKIIDISDGKVTECLHDNCPSCGGTGKRKDGLGMCVHMISCPCRKCSPWC